MRFRHSVFLLLFISALVLESDSWWRRRRRRRSPAGCSTPPAVAYTYRSGCSSPYTHGETCTYRCRSGYVQVSGSTRRTCSNGRWTGTNLLCRRGCPTPPTIPGAYRYGCSYPYTHAERCYYRCLHTGSTTNYQCVSGIWIGVRLVCAISNRREWPRGTYGLPRTNTGCPTHGGVAWHSGYRYHDTEDDDSSNSWTSGIHFDGGYWRNNMYQKFCMKTSSWSGSGSWPHGNYCIFNKYGCPSGFQNGALYWDDEDDDNRNHAGGVLPYGTYNRNTLIRYCCRKDRSASIAITLPNNKPFYLFRYTQGCQQVAGMAVREEYFRWDDEDSNNKNRKYGHHPLDTGGSSNHKLHYCYYS